MAVFTPSYFAPIAQFVAMKNSTMIEFEVCDNFQKQTYRNRCYIYGPNGKQILNVPIKKSKFISKQKTKDIEIDYSEDWQKTHLKSLETAYRASPFFQYYIDDLMIVFEKKHRFLLDLNILTHELIFEVLQETTLFSKTINYSQIHEKDYRFLSNPKQAINFLFKEYRQVFTTKHGFIENLSILDLLFNEGPNSFSLI